MLSVLSPATPVRTQICDFSRYRLGSKSVLDLTDLERWSSDLE